ncbi:MAG TPA: hypothetical protein VM120_26085 [Bryobacteraceae bacterium]|nr:hypothetical protein [Bryobacteraceae bacterium]
MKRRLSKPERISPVHDDQQLRRVAPGLGAVVLVGRRCHCIGSLKGAAVQTIQSPALKIFSPSTGGHSANFDLAQAAAHVPMEPGAPECAREENSRLFFASKILSTSGQLLGGELVFVCVSIQAVPEEALRPPDLSQPNIPVSGSYEPGNLTRRGRL